VAGEELDQLPAVRRLAAPDLRHAHGHLALGGRKPGVLVAVAPTELMFLPPLVPAAAEVVFLLLLERLLGEVADPELGEAGEDVCPFLHALCERPLDLLAHELARR